MAWIQHEGASWFTLISRGGSAISNVWGSALIIGWARGAFLPLRHLAWRGALGPPAGLARSTASDYGVQYELARPAQPYLEELGLIVIALAT